MINQQLLIVHKLINHIILNGEKKISEKIVLKSFKELHKLSLKQPKLLLQLAIIFSTPMFKMHEKVNKNRKKKKILETPVILRNKKARVSLALKVLVGSTKNKKAGPLYKKLCEEIFLTSQKKGLAFQLKSNMQKKILLKKRFFRFYKW